MPAGSGSASLKAKSIALGPDGQTHVLALALNADSGDPPLQPIHPSHRLQYYSRDLEGNWTRTGLVLIDHQPFGYPNIAQAIGLYVDDDGTVFAAGRGEYLMAEQSSAWLRSSISGSAVRFWTASVEGDGFLAWATGAAKPEIHIAELDGSCATTRRIIFPKVPAQGVIDLSAPLPGELRLTLADEEEYAVWDVTDGVELLRRIPRPNELAFEGPPHSVVWSRGGEDLYVCGEGVCGAWENASWDLVGYVPDEMRVSVFGGADETFLVTCSFEERVVDLLSRSEGEWIAFAENIHDTDRDCDMQLAVDDDGFIHGVDTVTYVTNRTGDWTEELLPVVP